ncbi:prepilin-type N-terminal cleavage/methylation domain-containing protein [Cohnella fermenti]|uniref:Prepilin-type N-terminal cleavage/methylation domain-containing protein n=1 Tax=Cohnella fermenti TaxID=2565925 RepID=A0A4S4BPX6_9BACL|nr:prepilin-type N-terminal cleavage/methylation domain-containing protein [Cohnella fermenti]THF76947.1 prepilin-type N-terminal cleavage/methylation domain-containing protein [Cohnella fermenti]
MNKFASRLRKEEKGLTLIELIASLSILSTVMIVLYGVVQFGFNSYHKITIENSLRDEGDLLMSSIIAELYELGPTKVSKVGGEVLLERDGLTHRISIEEGALHISDSSGGDGRIETASEVLDSSEIAVICPSGISECGSGLIEIKLELAQSYGGREQTMELSSKFGF